LIVKMKTVGWWKGENRIRYPMGSRAEGSGRETKRERTCVNGIVAVEKRKELHEEKPPI
jgi:hypothetical protein